MNTLSQNLEAKAILDFTLEPASICEWGAILAKNNCTKNDLHITSSRILLLGFGETPFDAMQRYAEMKECLVGRPMCTPLSAL